MTLAFKWSRRYEGEGSPGYDQCIELLKCSLIFISAVSRRGGSARAPLIRLQSPPATGPPPPRGRAPASAAAGSTPSARSAGAPSLDHAPAVVTPAWGGGCGHLRAGVRVWVGQGSGLVCVSCPHGWTPAHAWGQRQRARTFLPELGEQGRDSSCTGLLCGLGMFCRITGIR